MWMTKVFFFKLKDSDTGFKGRSERQQYWFQKMAILVPKSSNYGSKNKKFRFQETAIMVPGNSNTCS
jgi:hypothetical protein